jgi:hypothetical protein
MCDEDPPISYDDLRALFAFLNKTSATGYQCDHKYTLAERFLRERNLPVQPMLTWLGYNGAGCDCEIIFNTTAQWEERVGYSPSDEDA